MEEIVTSERNDPWGYAMELSGFLELVERKVLV
jgi:hypothetical protein